MEHEQVDPIKKLYGWENNMKRELFSLHEGRGLAYQWFVDVVLEKVNNSDKLWTDKIKANKLLWNSDVTVVDQAFALLLLDNSWDRWLDIAAKMKLHPQDQSMWKSNVATKYTVHGKDAKKNQGWKNQGLEYFNQLTEEVKESRQSEDGLAFQNEFRTFVKNSGRHGLRKRDRIEEEEEQIVEAVNELWDWKQEGKCI